MCADSFNMPKAWWVENADALGLQDLEVVACALAPSTPARYDAFATRKPA